MKIVRKHVGALAVHPPKSITPQPPSELSIKSDHKGASLIVLGEREFVYWTPEPPAVLRFIWTEYIYLSREV